MFCSHVAVVCDDQQDKYVDISGNMKNLKVVD
jgi:hypothetical protein